MNFIVSSSLSINFIRIFSLTFIKFAEDSENNYDLDIFNGDMGKVVEYDPEEQSALVNFDNNYVS